MQNREMADNTTPFQNASNFTSTFPTNSTESVSPKTQVYIAYIITSSFMFFTALPLLVMFVLNPSFKRKSCPEEEIGHLPDTQRKGTQSTQSNKRKYKLIILVVMISAFYFFLVSNELSFPGLLLTFVVQHLDWTKSKGALLTSVYWASFTLMRLASVFLAKVLTPSKMLFGDLIVTAAALIIILVAVTKHHAVVWISTSLFGIGLASVFPCGITWSSQHLQVSAKIVSLFISTGALANVVFPPIIGLLFANYGYMYIMYSIFTLNVCLFLCLVIMLIFQKFALPGKYD